MDDPRHPVGPEIDDSANPTAASPEDYSSSSAAAEDAGAAGGSAAADSTYQATGDQGRTAAGRDMLTQLQQMIDTLAVQATPVMRDVAAKAAELAAVAAERAGPLAHRAAEVTEKVGERVAVRSKEMAADLRAAQAREAGTQAASAPETAPAGGSAPPATDVTGAADTISSTPTEAENDEATV